MSIPPYKGPKDLVEALAVSPYYHLIPKQETTTFLSFFSLKHPSVSSLVPNDRLHETVSKSVEAMSNDPEAYKEAIDTLVLRFNGFSGGDLDAIKFKKPIIASEGVASGINLTLSTLYSRMIDSSKISNDDIIEDTANLGTPPCLGSNIRPDADRELSRQQYERLIAEEFGGEEKKTKRLLYHLSAFIRKRAKIDKYQLADATIVEFYDLLDGIDLECTSDLGGPLTKCNLDTLLRLLTRLLESNKLQELHSDYLRTLQKLCLNQLQVSPSETPQAILAARILMLVISVKGLDKDLYMETYIVKVVDFVSNLLARNHSKGDFEMTHEEIAGLSKLVNELSCYISSRTTDEQILTKLEYACLNTMFSVSKEAQNHDLIFCLILLLLCIFENYHQQRVFLVHEMLNNFTHLQKDCCIKQAKGVSTFTYTLVRMIQSFEVQFPKDFENYLLMPKSSIPSAPVNTKRKDLLETLALAFDESKLIARMISTFCVETLQNTERRSKIAFDILVDDLVKLLESPEYPGAVCISSTLLSHLVEALRGNQIPSANEPLTLELLGRIGAYILRAQSYNNVITSFDGPLNPSEVTELKDLMLSVIYASSSTRGYTTLVIFAKMHSLLSRASSGASQHGFFYTDPSERSKASDAEIALYDAIDVLLVSSSKKQAHGNHDSLSYTKLALALQLNSLYNDFLTSLTECLESTKVRLNTKAVKVLSDLIKIDASVLKLPKISTSISKLLESDAASSRDAILELLAKYISIHSDLLERYYMAICAKTTDESIAVRKRVIRIIRDFLPITDDIKIKAQYCIGLMKNLQDVEGNIKDLAKETLYKILLSPDDNNLKEVIEIMVSILGHTSQIQREFEHYILTSTKDKKHTLDTKLLKRLTESALESATSLFDTVDEKVSENALKLVFIFSDQGLNIVSQEAVHSLQPYIMPSNVGQHACCYALKIIRSWVSTCKRVTFSFAEQIEDVILKHLTRYSSIELHEAVQILDHLSKKAKRSKRVAYALCSCIKLLTTNMRNKCANEDPMVAKLIQIIGSFGAFCDFEDSREIIRTVEVGLKEEETVVSLILRLILHFTSVKDLQVQTSAMRSMLLTCTYHPKMFLLKPILLVLKSQFHNGTHKMKLTILEGFNTFLKKEETDSNRRNLDESCSSEKKLNVDVFYEMSQSNINDGVISSLIQGFINPALELCLQDASSLAIIPTKFIESIIKLGFANPKICAPTIIALEASPNKFVRRIATTLHQDIFDKHESLADRNYGEAFKLAVKYNRRVNSDEFLKSILFLRTVYRVVNRNYSSKKRFIHSLTRLFAFDSKCTDLVASIDTRDIIVFLAVNLSVLPFLSIEEVCLVLYNLDRSITQEGMDLVDRVTSTVGSQNEDTLIVETLQLLFVHSQSTLALIYLRQTLSAAYAIPHSLMETYLPTRPDVELRQPPKAITLIDFPLEHLEMDVKLSQPGRFGSLFTRFVTSMRDYTL